MKGSPLIDASRDTSAIAGWYKVSNEALTHITEIGLTAWAVYSVLCRFAHNKTQTCTVKVATTAALLGITDRAVRKATAKLIEAGMIERSERSTERGVQVANEYRILALPPSQQEEHTFRVPGTVVQGEAEPTFSPRAEPTFSPKDKDFLDKDFLDKDRSHVTSSRTANGDSAAFKVWWEHYPRKTGRKAAAKAYTSAVKEISTERCVTPAEAQERLLEAAKAFAASDKGRGAFVPYPTTWLNQGRYDDDPRTWTDSRNGNPKRQGRPYDERAAAAIGQHEF